MWKQLEPHRATGVDSRQGYLDRPVLVVLAVSILLAAMFMSLYWISEFGI